MVSPTKASGSSTAIERVSGNPGRAGASVLRMPADNQDSSALIPTALPSAHKTIAVALTGASGMPYGLRLVECLLAAGCRVWLLYSQVAQIVARQEMDIALPARPEEVEAQLGYLTPERRAASVEQTADLLRILGPQSADEWLKRGVRPQWLAQLIDQRRAIEVRVGNETRVSAIEGALTSLTSDMARADGTDELLLGHLSKLAADVESTLAASQYRYGASRAYYELVRARTQELREIRIAGTQTIDEFMARRLAPAMATCESVSRRLNGLSERVARASGLLSTRVDIARERQNQLLLASMERRAGLQLRLQETVEGLSVAAITYYVAGLIGYLAKAGSATGLPLNPDLVVGISIPCVAILTALAIRQMRRRIVDAER